MAADQRRAFSPYPLAALAAIAAGALRLASPFLDWTSPTPGLEIFALIVDVGLLFGLAGFYFANAPRLGAIGLAGFIVSAAGLAAITGPDGTTFGVDIYAAGAQVIGAGLLVFSVALLMACMAPLAAFAWIAAAIVSVAGGSMGQGELAFTIAGMLFALGFIAAGADLLRSR
ncbi:MAG: hypothetical protein ACK4NP_08370 [Parvularculaceae bacterium]